MLSKNDNLYNNHIYHTIIVFGIYAENFLILNKKKISKNLTDNTIHVSDDHK